MPWGVRPDGACNGVHSRSRGARRAAAKTRGARTGPHGAPYDAILWLPWLDAGEVRPQIFQTFPLAHAAAAHALMESSAHVGKIVLTI